MDMWFAQALGFVSYGLGMWAFYQKDDRRLKMIMCVFNLNHMIHYLLLGSTVSALASFISALRTGTSIYTSSKYIAIFFIIVTLSLGLYLTESWWQIWSVMGATIGTFTVFMLKGIAMRVGFLLASFCWLTNNILVGSIGGTLLEATLTAMNLFTIYRLYQQNKLLAENATI
ncbi:YgjV family protein [Vibrio sp. RC27]